MTDTPKPVKRVPAIVHVLVPTPMDPSEIVIYARGRDGWDRLLEVTGFDIHPLPPPLTPEAQAVLAAAVSWSGWFKNYNDSPWRPLPVQRLLDASAAYRASIAPPQVDPVEELIAIVEQHANIAQRSGGFVEAGRMRAAVARARGAKP